MTTTTDALHVLRGMYAAEARYLAAGGPGRAGFESLAPFFAPDAVLHQAGTLPYGGVRRGHEGMERFFVAMHATWASFEMLEQEFVQTVRVRDGRITEVRPFYWDTAAIGAACGQ